MTTSWWFYVQDDRRLGPVDLDRLLHMVVTAELDAQTLVWRHGLPEWTEVARVAEIATRLPPPVPPTPTAPVSPLVDELRRRLEKDPAARVFALVAEELRREGELEESVRVCREGLQRYSPYPSLQLTLGRALLEDGDPVLAHAELEAVLRAAPDNIVARRLLEECRQALAGAVGAPEPDASPEAAASPGAAPAAPEAAVAAPDPPAVPPTVESAPPLPPEPARAAARASAPVFALEQAEDWTPSGRLADRDFADLIQQVHTRRWNGLLTLNHVGVEKSVRVEDGQLVFATSSSRDDRLGELLLRHGKITLDQYVAAGLAVGKNKRLGTVLVEQGALDPREMVKVVIDQTQEIIYSLFQWTEGLYYLTEGPDAAVEPITLKLSTPHVIIKGISRVEAWSRVERAVGGAYGLYARAADWESMLSQMTLSSGRLAILTELVDVQDVAAICRASSLPHFEVCQMLWAFRVMGLVKRVG